MIILGRVKQRGFLNIIFYKKQEAYDEKMTKSGCFKMWLNNLMIDNVI